MELSAVTFFSLVLGCIMDGYAETMITALSRRKGTAVDTEAKMLDKFKELESSLKVNMQITKTELKAIKQRLRHVEQEREMYRERLGKVNDELSVTRQEFEKLRSELNGTINDLSNTRQVTDGLTQDVKKLTTCCVMSNETAPATTTASTDQSQVPSLSTTVPPATTQDSDQRATPSTAAGRNLYDASYRGDLETVRQILSAGHVDINYRGRWSRTPVMVAAYRGHRDVVEFLVDKGADLSLVEEYGNNILHCACLGGYLETAKLILSRNMADINSRGRWSRTPVMAAAYRGHRDVVEFLVGEGADLSLLDEYGNNILYWASEGGDVETVKLILSRNLADINSRGRWSRTSVMAAALYGRRDMVEFLVGEGADVSLVDKFGSNILHVACDRGHLEVVNLILSRNLVDVNARKNDGETAADVARDKGHQQVVDLLVSRGAV